jgi:hypothetical protein
MNVRSPQVYTSCAQINITGGGTGTPEPLVPIPGAYNITDPAFQYDLNNLVSALSRRETRS